jgi:beta-lactamase regulating signal transducer with metallopeptidase domain
MNDLGLMLMAAAFRVTLLALAAVVLYAVAARRGPGAGAPVAAACLGGSAVLTLLALCPLPSWWALRVPPGSAVVTEAPLLATSETDNTDVSLSTLENASPSAPNGSGVGLSWSSDFLRRGWERMHQATLSPPSTHWDWPGTAAVIFLIGLMLCLLRLLIGFWAIRECRRRSQSVIDGELLQLAESLRIAMRCPRRVEIRECPDLASPATVGWLRPVVLLPSDWRGWSEVERRAVLAHELAHVSRSDFLTGLLARVGVALHFYHPLLHWMASRLHLQQELAADALAVRFVGGRDSYLRTLARLALRQDGRPTAWPVHALFSSQGTLMRRIHMLRTKEGIASPSLPRWGRLLLVGPLVAVAISVSALRSPAQKADEPAKGADTPQPERFYAGGFNSLRGFAFRGAGQEFRSEAVPGTQLQRYQAEQEPFDLSYVPPDAMGVVAFRPAALFGRPALKKYAGEFDRTLRDYLGSRLKLPEGRPPRAEEIEQVISAFYVKTDKTKKEGQSSLLFCSLSMLRTVHDYDWAKLLKALLPGAVEVEYAGRIYYRFPEKHAFLPISTEVMKDYCFFTPDSRTVVIDKEKNVRRLIGRKPGEEPGQPWAKEWKQVERGLFAVVLDNSDGSWRREWEERTNPDPAGKPFYENVTWVVFGGSGTDTFVLDVLAHCGTEARAEKVAKAAESLLEMGRVALAANLKEEVREEERILLEVFTNWLKGFSVYWQGNTIHMFNTSKVSLDKVLLAFIKLELSHEGEEPTPQKKP